MTSDRPPLPPSSGLASNAALIRLTNYAQQNQVSAGTGVTLGQGNALSVRNPALRTRPYPTSSRQPFRLSGFIDTGPTAKIRVAPGMVNNFIPTIGGISLVAVPAPAITVTGSTGQIWLRATVDGAGAITALELANLTATPTDTGTLKHKLVGTWTASGGAFTSVVSILDANQAFYLCNGTPIWEA